MRVLAALRIVFDVFVFRVRKLEMANLAAAFAIMVALRLPLEELAVRGTFAGLLNLLAYLTNDYYDVDRDLASGRDDAKTRFLSDHRGAAIGAQLGLAALMVAIALVTYPDMIAALVLGGGICWIYSAKLKALPFVDVVAMIAWGATMPLAAVPLDRPLGFWLLGQLGLFSAVFETVQVLRDRERDRAIGVETTAVRIGAGKSLALARAFACLSGVYAALVLHRYFGLIALAGVLLPYRGNPDRYWNLMRLVLGVCWLACIAAIFLREQPHGWLPIVVR